MDSKEHLVSLKGFEFFLYIINKNKNVQKPGINLRFRFKLCGF